MSARNFRDLLESRWSDGTCVCVGLDSDLQLIPESARKQNEDETIFAFNRAIVDATHEQVCAYKVQVAFYEAAGINGIRAMIRTVESIKQVAPNIPIIGDAKRGDVASTNEAYAKAMFDEYGFDAVTLHPYLGKESLEPFLRRDDKGLFILCRTSNPGARELQDLEFAAATSRSMVQGWIASPLWKHVATRVAKEWNDRGNCGLVVGATYPDELREVRSIARRMPILIPGIGSQGGDLEKAVLAGKDDRGRGMIINSSRSIIFASKGRDFAEAARRETIRLREEVNRYL